MNVKRWNKCRSFRWNFKKNFEKRSKNVCFWSNCSWWASRRKTEILLFPANIPFCAKRNNSNTLKVLWNIDLYSVNPRCLLCETCQTEVWVCGVNVGRDNRYTPSRAELLQLSFLLSSFSPSQLDSPVVLSPQLFMFLLVYVIIYKLALWNSWENV